MKLNYDNLLIIVSKFDTTKDGKVMWFSAPPVQVLSRQVLTHSLPYMKWKCAQPERSGVS